MVLPSDFKKEKLSFEEGWRLLKKLDEHRAVYERCSYDEENNLVRSNFRRIYDGKDIEAEYTVNAKEQRDGQYIKYTKKDIIISNFKEDILDGAYEEYDQDGILRLKGTYKKGERIGVWLELYKDGTQKRQIVYANAGLTLADSAAEEEKATEEETKQRPIGFGPYDKESTPKKSKEVITLPSISTEGPDPTVTGDPETKTHPVVRNHHVGGKKKADNSNVHS